MAYGQRPGQDGEQAGGDGRWQPPEWRYGQQPHEQGNGQRGYAPGQPTARFQPVPPSQPGQPGQPGFGPPPPQPPYQPPLRGKSWPARHKALTGLLAFGALIIIIVAANAGKSPSSPGSSVAAGMTTIVEGKLNTPAEYILVFTFCVWCSASYLLLETYAAVRPDKVQVRLQSILAWINTHRDETIVFLSLGLGLYLMAKSIYELVSA